MGTRLYFINCAKQVLYFCYNYTYLSKMFKTVTRQYDQVYYPTGAWNKRILREKSELSIRVVFELVGSGQSYYSRTFKTFTGMSPSE